MLDSKLRDGRASGKSAELSRGVDKNWSPKKAGICTFLDCMRSPESKVSLIEFESKASVLIPLQPAVSNRTYIKEAVSRLFSKDQTALLDALELAMDEITRRGNPTHIQAIIVLTDGRENASSISLFEVESRLARCKGVILYCIAYGRDADQKILNRLANLTGGIVVSGDLPDIEQLYRQLSRHV